MWLGILFSALAGMMWGQSSIGPLLLPEYSGALLSFGRYFAFGMIALPLAWFDRANLRQLGWADWIEALKLTLVGNLLSYLFLACAVQRSGGLLPAMIMGTLPVVLPIGANLRNARRDGRLPWKRLLPSLLLIAAGVGCVNQVELAALRHERHADVARYVTGALLGIISVACWAWYALRNADWLRNNPERNPRTWATALGVATLPLALTGYVLLWAGLAMVGSDFPMPLGPRPAFFITLMVLVALFASWIGTLCWNESSQRLPTALAGQLIVFETLAAVVYAFMLRGRMPESLTLLGVGLLIVGVLWAVRVKPEPVMAEGHVT